jgi:hypothetical protein
MLERFVLEGAPLLVAKEVLLGVWSECLREEKAIVNDGRKVGILVSLLYASSRERMGMSLGNEKKRHREVCRHILGHHCTAKIPATD